MARTKKATATPAEAKPKAACKRGPKAKAAVKEVTLELTNEAAENASEVAVAGEFNNWDKSANKMTKTLNGFEAKLTLEPGKSYQFKYVLDGEKWILAPGFKTVDNGLGSENSVIE